MVAGMPILRAISAAEYSEHLLDTEAGFRSTEAAEAITEAIDTEAIAGIRKSSGLRSSLVLFCPRFEIRSVGHIGAGTAACDGTPP